MKTTFKFGMALIILLVSIAAVSAAPVTVQDGALNVSNNFWVNINKFFVDSSGGDVGIGTDVPSAKLEVVGAIKSTDWTNVTITESQINDYGANATSDFNFLDATDNATLKTYIDESDDKFVNGSDIYVKNLILNQSMSLGWKNLTDYPIGCNPGYTVNEFGDTITCIPIQIYENQIQEYAGNSSSQMILAVQPNWYYNATRINTTVLVNQSGKLGIVTSWFNSVYLTIADFGIIMSALRITEANITNYAGNASSDFNFLDSTNNATLKTYIDENDADTWNSTADFEDTFLTSALLIKEANITNYAGNASSDFNFLDSTDNATLKTYIDENDANTDTWNSTADFEDTFLTSALLIKEANITNYKANSSAHFLPILATEMTGNNTFWTTNNNTLRTYIKNNFVNRSSPYNFTITGAGDNEFSIHYLGSNGDIMKTSISTGNVLFFPDSKTAGFEFGIGVGTTTGHTFTVGGDSLLKERVSINTTETTHALNIKNTLTEDLLRLHGPEGNYEYGAKINFGDGDYAYITESNDDKLEIRGYQGVVLNATNVYTPSIAAVSGTDYVCVGTSGVLSSGASCTSFKDLKSSSEVLTTDQLKVLKVMEMKYPADFPLGSLRGTVKEYIYTVAFNLQGVTMEGKIKVPGNMDKGEILYYLKKKIETERGINSLVESQVSDSSVGKVYAMSEINYVAPKVETKK